MLFFVSMTCIVLFYCEAWTNAKAYGKVLLWSMTKHRVLVMLYLCSMTRYFHRLETKNNEINKPKAITYGSPISKITRVVEGMTERMMCESMNWSWCNESRQIIKFELFQRKIHFLVILKNLIFENLWSCSAWPAWPLASPLSCPSSVEGAVVRKHNVDVIREMLLKEK